MSDNEIEVLRGDAAKPHASRLTEGDRYEYEKQTSESVNVVRFNTLLARINKPGEFENKGWSADPSAAEKVFQNLSNEQKTSLLDACAKLNSGDLKGADVEIATCKALEASPNIAAGQQQNTSRGL